MEILIAEYVSKQIEELANRNDCCINWFGPYCKVQPILARKIANFGLKSQIHIIDSCKVTKIYKTSCNHTVNQPRSFQLSEQSQKDILKLLKKCDYDGFHQDMLIPSKVFKPARQKPVLPPNRFTIGPLRHNIYHTNAASTQSLQQSWRIYPFRKEILQKIRNNRVLVVNGDVSLEKSTAVPMFVVEDSTATGIYCKILCVESDNLSAITHCTVLTKYVNERIGSRVGFQVYLQSRVCDNTNLIYTTAVFFLRVLMGQCPNESFRHITHIVVSDVHLHHAYTDILLHELKNILPHYPQIKIILLSNSDNNTKLLSYFGEGEELQLKLKLYDLKLHYVEDIRLMIENDQNRVKSLGNVDDILPSDICKDNIKEKWADKSLEEYETTGCSDAALSRFLYHVHGGSVSIDHIHSKLGFTALIAAANHGKTLHLTRLLTIENANPFVQDKRRCTALEYAISKNNVDCARALLKFMQVNVYEHKPPPIDFDLIKQLVQLITTTWQFGHILIFLPTYEDLLKLSYDILKLQFIGRIPQEICVYLLHPNMQYDQLQPIIAESIFIKIILTTTLGESLTYLSDITYVIDASLNCVERYHPESKCKKSTNEWASKESLQRRATIASRFTDGHCFRLIPRKLYGKLPSLSTPELLSTSMNRISLTVKLLCPHKTVVEYFQNTIVKPPFKHILHSVEFLKKIEVFDCMEDATWLGCRLIDVPVDLELGKSLVLSILLKCLDPVLTIVSFLTCTDSTEIARCKSYFLTEGLLHKKDKLLFAAETSYSDHLTLLRLYQVWQNERRENTINDILSDEDTYIINGVLDKVCGIRTHLVGALRSSQLIHNQGQLSMHSINSKANNWAVIKAALACGLYPKFSMIDRNENQIKSQSRMLRIHSSSILREPSCGPSSVQHYPSDWIAFFRETNSFTANSISNCTLISPVTIALFAGKTELDPENISFQNGVVGGCAAFYIDEWIWLRTDVPSALLLYKLRQRFYNAYLDFLQTCGNSEKWRKPVSNSNEISRVFDLISKILLEEDLNCGFAQPNRVGNRPKAVANKFTSDFNIAIQSKPFEIRGKVNNILSSLIRYRCLEKEFFLINLFDSHEVMKLFWKQPMFDITKEKFFDSICSSASLQKLTYVLLCSMTRKRLTNVALVRCNKGGFILKNCFQVNIPVHDVIIMCVSRKLPLPPFTTDRNPIRLDNRVGEVILDLL